MRGIRVFSCVLGGVALLVTTASCSQGMRGEDVSTARQAVTAADAITRAEEWVTAKLLYCQSPNGANDTIDPSCPAVCMRTSNPAWDPYRSDCSGLVSWAWGLPAPGWTTAEFAPNQSDITQVIQAATLQTGDAVNTDDSVSSEHHIMLFKAWTSPGVTATFIEEPGCSANPNYAHEFTSNVTLNGTQITVAYNGITFSAIRYGALGAAGTGGAATTTAGSSSGSPPPSCSVNGVAGTCIDTSVCATMAGYVSTPGYCPGPASEQCCTLMDGTVSSSSESGSGGSSGFGGSPATSGAGGANGGGGTTTTASTSGSGATAGATTSGTGTGGGSGTSKGTGGANGGQKGTGAASNPNPFAGSNNAQSGCAATPAQPASSAAPVLAALLLLLRRRRRS